MFLNADSDPPSEGAKSWKTYAFFLPRNIRNRLSNRYENIRSPSIFSLLGHRGAVFVIRYSEIAKPLAVFVISL